MTRRLCIWGGVGALMLSAAYLWAVRGTAILMDLYGLAAGVFCL